VTVGCNVHIGGNARIEGIMRYEGVGFSPSILIGDGVSIQQNIHLTCASRVEIGANTAIAANVSITDINHPYENPLLPPERQPIETKPVAIGEDCKIYNNAVILPGTVLGRHTIVAANSVVTGRTYPPFCVLAGAPAVIKRKYVEQEKRWALTDARGNVLRVAED
jgi:acetyltransferase-like isoleucine patch superfamily enzyme